MIYCISRHQKAQARWFHYFSLVNSRHSNDDFYDMQTMCKPKNDPSKPNSAMCKLFHSICKPQNLGDSEEFCKILSWHSLFSWAYYVPHIPGSICWSHFFGWKKSLHGLHRFTPDCPPMGPSVSKPPWALVAWVWGCNAWQRVRWRKCLDRFGPGWSLEGGRCDCCWGWRETWRRGWLRML